MKNKLYQTLKYLHIILPIVWAIYVFLNIIYHNGIIEYWVEGYPSYTFIEIARTLSISFLLSAFILLPISTLLYLGARFTKLTFFDEVKKENLQMRIFIISLIYFNSASISLHYLPSLMAC